MKLSSEYDLHRSQFFKYLQLRHAIMPYLSPLDEIPEHNPLEARVLLTYIKSHKISHIYRTLVRHTPDTFENIKDAWLADLPELSSEDWAEALMSLREAAIASQFRLIQLKYLHRIYYTRDNLWRRGLIPSRSCLRCQHETGDFLHTVWSCGVVAEFWSEVIDCLEVVISIRIPPYSLLCSLTHF